jgi:hypothetical protein
MGIKAVRPSVTEYHHLKRWKDVSEFCVRDFNPKMSGSSIFSHFDPQPNLLYVRSWISVFRHIMNCYSDFGEIRYEMSLHDVNRPFSFLAVLTDYGRKDGKS